jgi:hypothetical protein
MPPARLSSTAPNAITPPSATSRSLKPPTSSQPLCSAPKAASAPSRQKQIPSRSWTVYKETSPAISSLTARDVLR